MGLIWYVCILYLLVRRSGHITDTLNSLSCFFVHSRTENDDEDIRADDM